MANRKRYAYEIEGKFVIADKEWNVKFVKNDEIYYGFEEAITDCKDEVIALLQKYIDMVGDIPDNDINVSFKKIKTVLKEDSSE
jgi:hypothetical protein